MCVRLKRADSVLQMFVWWLVIAQTGGTNIKLLPNENDIRLSTIFKQFDVYDIVVHVDEMKMAFLTILGAEHLTNAVTIFKYTPEKYIFHRPRVQKCVHYVVQEGDRFFLQHYSHVDGNVEEEDVVILLTKTLDSKRNYSALYNTGVDNANIAFYLNRTLGFAIFFYRSPDLTPDVQEVTRSIHGEPELAKYGNDFLNFQGFPLKVGFTRCPPFIYHENEHVIGVEFKIMEVVVKLLNFTPQFEDYSMRKDGRLNLINDVNKSILHCAIGCLSNNVYRNEKVSFSTMLQSEPHIIVYSSGYKYDPPPIYLLLDPLQQMVWVCVICTLIIVILFVKLLEVYEGNRDTINPVLLPISILLEQSIAIPPKSNALRFSLVTWLLVGFALSSSYKSKLTAALIMPPSREPIHLRQLVSEGYHFISPAEDSTYLMELLQMSDDQDIHFVGHDIEDTKDVCEAIVRANRDLSAVVEEQTVLRYKVWNYCYQNLSLAEMQFMRRLEHPITVNGHVWAMPKSSPYKERISKVIEMLKSVGLVQKWYRSYNISRPIAISNTVKKRGDTEPLEPYDLVSAYIVLLMGCLLSLIQLILEVVIHSGHAFTRPFKHLQGIDYSP